MMVPNVPQMPSVQAQELGQKISYVIQEFRQRHPDLSSADVRAAMEVARAQSGGGVGTDRKLRVVAASGVAMLVAGVGMFGMVAKQGGAAIPGTAWPVIGAGAAVVAVVFAMLRLRGRD